eukprot:s989_g8.t2
MLEGEVNGPQYGSMREERQMATGQSPLKDVIGLQRVATKNVIGLQRATKDVIGLQRATKDAIGLQRATKDVIGLQRVVEYQSVIRSIVPEGLRVKLPSTSACWQETELYVINNDSNLSMIHRKIKQLKVTRVVRVPQQWNCWASYIATGMKQLQDVQLRQMEKKPDLPEVVKRGISSLPTLSSPGQDTSPVDIQDWLEEVGSVMTDLSDSSWDWWLQTKELAEDHYRKWIKSTPMEKISLAMPKNPSLEQGRYGRVNARAAGMVLAALPQEVKSEMITKKISGSTASLIFKLLTAYRPGREKEKTLFLQQLTSPEAAAAAEEAVQGLRRWGRWHARAKDLTVMKVSGDGAKDQQGTLLDSGSTHILRPAKDETECKESQQVYVILAGDEKRLLNQTASGSIVVDPDKAKDVQSIVPFGKVIHHPKHGRIKTRVRAGCPEITDAGQAAAIIPELEMKKVAELKEKTQELQDQLTAIRMIEDRKADWRVLLARYSEQGQSADGLQALFTSPVFANIPNEVRTVTAPAIDPTPAAGWDYLKLLPLPRRMRKRLHK